MEEWKPILLVIARILLIITGTVGAVGGGATMVVGGAEQEAKVETAVERTKYLDDRLEWLRQGVLQRVDVEEKEREEDVEALRERVAALEARLARLER